MTTCARCNEQAIIVAVVWSDLLRPSYACYSCTLDALKCQDGIGALTIELLPITEIPANELH